MCIDSRRAVFRLPNSIKIQEDSFDILFILEKEGILDSLTKAIHFLEAYFFLLFIKSILI